MMERKMFSVSPISRASARYRHLKHSSALAGLAVLAAPLDVSAQALYCDPAALPLARSCLHANAGTSVDLPVGANTEQVAGAPGESFAETGFSISIDNTPIAGALPPYNPERAADIALARSNVDVRFDGLGGRRLLNVATNDLRASYPAGETVTFRASANYPAFIDRAEIRILDLSEPGRPVVATIPTAPNGTASWVMPASGEGEYAYTLRVYDAKGRYDETLPLSLTRTGKRFASHETVGGPLVAAGEGESRMRVRRIPVRGGTVVVSGNGVPNGTVSVMGEEVPVDASGKFVVSRMIPAGDHVVSVNTGGRQILRDVHVPKSEWFGTGIVDITAGYSFGGTSGVEDEGYVDGRAAFYAKGETESGWQITAGADTSEGPIEEMFERLNDKDPERVLDRLRTSDDIYPTYGDTSTWYDDTPTAGAFYFRAENETTRFTWGDFETGITSPGLVSASRDLYGAELRYRSAGVTANGDPRLEATLYAAQPDTLPQRDVLLGTGGSVYFLTRQDITGGSTSAQVQITDPDTGRIVQTIELTEGTDYSVDHIQGVITLSQPLSWYTGESGTVGDLTGSYDQSLIVQYEYTPTDVDVDSVVVGGRATAWVNDNVRIGATAMREETDDGTQTVAGADARFQFGRQSFAEVEVVRSSGPGIERSTSTDGGLTIVSTGGDNNGPAMAAGFDSYFDFEDLGVGTPGHIAFYAERKEAGFWSVAEDIDDDQFVFGGEVGVEVNDRVSLLFEGERYESDAGDEDTEVGARVKYVVSDEWTVTFGAKYLDQITPGDADETGTRLNAGAKVAWSPNDDLTLYTFGQYTVKRTGGLDDDHRIGVGAEVQLTEKLRASGEVSTGTEGEAASARLTWSPTPDREVYLGYTLDPTRYGAGSDLIDNGRVVTGGRYQFSESVSVYGESAFDLPGDRQSLTNTYGVNYTPDAAWTLSGSFDYGEVRDEDDGNFDRLAASFGAAWSPSDEVAARVRLEYRTEDGEGLDDDRDTYMFSAGYTTTLARDWSLVADVEGLHSESALGDYHDGTYVRGSIGFAFRPIENERLNALFMYTRLIDLPGEDQVDANGDTDGPQQKSHVFSFNANYDLSPQLTVGGKIGYRMSETADRGSDDFSENTAALTALRLDWHVVHEWDLFGEGRVMYTPETGTTETGALIGVYRHLGEHAKLGVGYEWGRVSDDLTDIDYENQGLFVNLVGKF